MSETETNRKNPFCAFFSDEILAVANTFLSDEEKLKVFSAIIEPFDESGNPKPLTDREKSFYKLLYKDVEAIAAEKARIEEEAEIRKCDEKEKREKRRVYMAAYREKQKAKAAVKTAKSPRKIHPNSTR